MIRRHAAALAIYAVLAVLLIGHGASLQNYIYGISSDPLSFIWCLAWWPHALLHHLDPLHAVLSGNRTGWISSGRPAYHFWPWPRRR